MRVGSEPCSGCNAVFIDYAQRSEELVLRVLIARVMSQNSQLTITEGEKGYVPAGREGVERFEPAKVGIASFFALPGGEFQGTHVVRNGR